MTEKEKLAESINKKKPSNLVEITEEENRKIIEKIVDEKIVDEKSPNLVGLLRKKTDALWVRLKFKR